MAEKKYQALFLDLDNTLLDFTASEHRAIRRVLGKYNLPQDDATVFLYSDINRRFWEAYERGDIAREDIFVGRFRQLLTVLGQQRDADCISADYFVALSEGHDLVPGAVDLLQWLKVKGYALYATTNGVAKTQFKRIKDAEIDGFFNAVFVSEAVGAQKPDYAYFDFIFKKIPFCAERVLLVGDSLTSDIAGGIAAGIDTCWYNPVGTKTDLQPTYTVGSLAELKKIL